MFKVFSAITRGCHRLCSKFGTLGGRIWRSLFLAPDYPSRQHHHHIGSSNLSPIEEARLRHYAYWGPRQW